MSKPVPEAERKRRAVARQLRYAATPKGKANIRENQRRYEARLREAAKTEAEFDIVDVDGELEIQLRNK
jgi:hypothetical protein